MSDTKYLAVIVIVIGFIMAPLMLGQAQQPPQQQMSPQEAMTRLAAQVTACDAERKTMESMVGQAAVQQVANAEAVRADDRKQFEAANPGKTLDVKWKVVDVKAAEPAK